MHTSNENPKPRPGGVTILRPAPADPATAAQIALEEDLAWAMKDAA